MNRPALLVCVITLTAALLLLAAGQAFATVRAPAEAAAEQASAGRDVSIDDVNRAMEGVSLPFVPNAGQQHPDVRYSADLFAGTMFVTGEGLTYSIPPDGSGRALAVRESFLGGDGEAAPLDPVELEGGGSTVSCFLGDDPSRWRSGLATSRTLDLGELFPGIKVSLHARGNNAEKVFCLSPGAEPGDIRVRMEGAASLSVSEKGDLIIGCETGELSMTAPVAYQVDGGARRSVDAAYRLVSRYTYGFSVTGGYDRGKPLFIDPLLASTYIGGSNDDILQSIALDASGDVYVAGYSASADYPTTTGAYQEARAGNSDGVVSRFDSGLTTLKSSTYIGGVGYDSLFSISLDTTSGDVYVAGLSYSDNYPTTTGAYQEARAGNSDGVVSRFDSGLTTLKSSTYIGGVGYDSLFSISLDTTSGDVYVAGLSYSANYPTTTGAYQEARAGNSDGVVSRFDSGLTTLKSSTYIGGGVYDSLFSIALSTSGDVYVAGVSNSGNYPTTTGAYQPANAGNDDGVVSSLDSELTTLDSSTYIGGDSTDYLYSITLDTSGNVYVAGYSDSGSYPTTTGAYQPANAGNEDGVVSRFDSVLTTLDSSTYIGGSDNDELFSIALNTTSGDVYVAGYSYSGNYPTTTGAYQPANAGNWDGVVSRFDSVLTTLNSSTDIGGSEVDKLSSVALNTGTGAVCVAGYSGSGNYPTTNGAYQPANAGTVDGVVSWFDKDLSQNTAPAVTTTAPSDITSTTASSGGNVTSGGGHPVTARGVCWSISANPTTAGSHTTDGTGTGAFTSNLPSLAPGTLYHVRAYATNFVGTSYGSDLTFTTTNPVTTTTWYLAEGTNAWGFSTYITIENPNNSAVTARLTYIDPNPASGAGVVGTRDVALPPLAQTTVSSTEDIGAVDFSTKVECLQGKQVAVDRTMFWTGDGAASAEGHSSIGTTTPSKTWYLPEGSSVWGFETWTLLLNPNPTRANVRLTYMTEDQGSKVLNKVVPPNSRATYSMAADIGTADASIEVRSDIPVVAERSMYRNNRREGSCSIGATSPATDYFLAEGACGYDAGFSTWVLIQNPNDSDVEVTLTYQTPEGPKPQAPFTMGANSRKSVRVNDALPSNTDVSTTVHGSKPVIAERAMYWGADTPSGEAMHASVGIDSTHMSFYLPDGQASEGFETWTLIANPNPGAVTVRMTYLPQGGGTPVSFTDEIGPLTRSTYNMADKGISGRASIMVESLDGARPIIVERAMYWNNRGAGTDTIGGFSD